ncbi:hypothetical protein Q4566_05820 [Tamlana sp. 2_MG-2023]|uniref:hypothetical protein n=1 Tax=unclassified Tamlana TaxID=2614803 RepID=UPI0026E40960|nr:MULTISPECIES: hypothetical protein [unclassified Tamlana]MDO6759711.1 hypothetical protein [Tamlana sp. 2_MG-2023]MDO6791334.1 hypothetical protein [Tamlana sp. 1_MG-2023]
MSDYLTVLLVMISVGLLFLTPAAFFGGKTGVIITVIILTAISCYLLMYAIGLGKSFGNSSAPTSFRVESLLPYLKFAALYAFIGYGAFCFSQMEHGVEGYKIKWLVCTLILVGYPAYLFASEVISESNTKLKYYKTDIVIAHPVDFPVQIDQLRFFDSKTKKSTPTHYRYMENDLILSDFEGLDVENNPFRSHRYYKEGISRYLPISFDSFELSWYSILEQRFYKDVFRLDQEKLKTRQESEGQMVISDMLINILPKGHVDLLKREYMEYIHVAAYGKVAFTAVDGQSLDEIFGLFTPIGAPDDHKANRKRDYAKIEQDITHNLSPEEILSFRSVYNYDINVEYIQYPNEVKELKEIEIIDFYLNQYKRSPDFLSERHTKPLPSYMKLKLKGYDKDKRPWIEIGFDKKLLFHAYNTFAEEHNEAISFEILVDIKDLNKSKIWLKSKEEKMSLDGWKMYK